ncbi:hypothetical protein B6U99_03330 [Candidatus Geothermarchaeota archaeon ex4572_27]|nr:MAG: hypothetical protein B6U99_03330 [Candidatus Geothermarchaeota archaeon ex4572_27]
MEEVVRVIEDFSPVSVSVGLAQYWVMRALERGSVLVVGQGSDEAYGGYQRFADAYREGGEEAAAWEVRRSIIHSYRVNFEREWRLSLHLGVEILYPLISPGMVYYVGRLPLAARVRGPDDALRKHIVRLAASAMGVPREIAGARKRSMQYSTGAMKALRDVARAHGLKPHQYLYKKYMDLFAGQGGGPGLG